MYEFHFTKRRTEIGGINRHDNFADKINFTTGLYLVLITSSSTLARDRQHWAESKSGKGDDSGMSGFSNTIAPPHMVSYRASGSR